MASTYHYAPLQATLELLHLRVHETLRFGHRTGASLYAALHGVDAGLPVVTALGRTQMHIALNQNNQDKKKHYNYDILLNHT